MLVEATSIDATFERLHGLAAGPPSSVEKRRQLLRTLRDGMLESKSEICDALFADFEKSPVEVELTELATTLLEIKSAIRQLDDWMAPTRVRAPFPFWSTKSFVTPQPKGVVLVVSPWNYPVLLSLAPVTSAIAAGNRVVLKPSERTPNTSEVLEQLVSKALGPEWCVVIQGDADTGAHLLSKPFDHFFFTGSPQVGEKVMEAAAAHLSSATLELGGKSPAIVGKTADVKLAAKKIVTGKFLNAGQTCIAPDYVITEQSCFDTTVEALQKAAQTIRDEHEEEMTGIVDERHADRLAEMWNDAHSRGASKADGADLDLNTVSIITNVPSDARIMEEEIFGPLLPVVAFDTPDDILGLVESTGPPLTAYLFTQNEKFANELQRRLKTGSICRDETLLHFAHPELPFGGVGSSGNGRTHGENGFRAFSNEVSVLRSRKGLSVLPLLFPVKGRRENLVRKWLMRWLKR